MKLTILSTILAIALFSTACGSNEKHIYKGNLTENNLRSAKSQIDHKDVEAVIETVNKDKSRLFFNSKDGLNLGNCQQPLEFGWYDDKKKITFLPCKLRETSELRNIYSSSIRLDGQNIVIDINIDDNLYTFRGTEIGK